MGQLLLHEDRPLRKSKEEDEMRTLARARTLTALSRLDGSRKRSVLQFLYETDLITRDRAVVDLTGPTWKKPTCTMRSYSGPTCAGQTYTMPALV